MTAQLLKSSVAAIAATLIGFSFIPSTAQAGTQPLVGYDVHGNAVNSGWVASWATAYDGQIDLTYRGSSGNQFFFEKDATLTAPAGNGIDGVEILFTKVDPNAKDLVINDEIIRNQTGTNWNGFQWILASANNSGGTPSFAFNTSDGTAGLGDFNITPFTTFNFSNSNSVLSFSGGSVDNGSTWYAGAGSSTGIAIVANNTTDSFVLKEVPVAIPLPAAAWTGMTTLLGLGLLAAAKNARKILA